MFETSQTTAKLDAALAKAQGEIEAAEKSAANDAFKRNGKATRYADLTAVWDAIRPVMSKHGIAITQWPVHSDDGRLHLITRLAHDGEWIKSELSIPVNKPDAHGYGSATTYAKRYGLAAAVGVVADEDDDGNGAVGDKPKHPGLSASIHEPDNHGPGEPFNGTKGVAGRPKYKGGTNTAPAEYMFIEASIRAQRSVEDLQEWGSNPTNQEAIAKLPAEWIPNIRNEFKERLSALKEAA
jgi:hypothetical protein